MKIDRNQLKSLGRVMGYVTKTYKGCCIIVVLCILITALTTLATTLFMRTLIDDYIDPLVAAATPDFAPLAQALMQLAAILLVGVCCSYARSRIMVNVSQGTLKRLRIDLFTNMESLPIKYFDTHAHGDIMSVYTNDVDTMRQVISESTPQLINSVITLVSTFVSMIVLSVPLTLVSVAMVAVMLLVSTRLSGVSGSYFTRQQHDLGTVNGYIEEMMQGQKVVKVFCHEDRSLEQFRELNDQLRDSANNAHRIANIMMPINNNLGHISYVLCAVVGAVLALNVNFGLTIGTLV
ncbi:MAG: ABC transporter ATP-binding protein, partial [Clostridiales bacterium]|nr:ABC transporter ATP-binding protein [Clostridiales bacterium]